MFPFPRIVSFIWYHLTLSFIQMFLLIVVVLLVCVNLSSTFYAPVPSFTHHANFTSSGGCRYGDQTRKDSQGRAFYYTPFFL